MLCRIPFGADEETKNEGYSVSGSITISTLPAISMTFAFAQAFVSTSSGEFDVSAFRTDVGALLGHVAKVVCSGSVRVASDGLFRSKTARQRRVPMEYCVGLCQKSGSALR